MGLMLFQIPGLYFKTIVETYYSAMPNVTSEILTYLISGGIEFTPPKLCKAYVTVNIPVVLLAQTYYLNSLSPFQKIIDSTGLHYK